MRVRRDATRRTSDGTMLVRASLPLLALAARPAPLGGARMLCGVPALETLTVVQLKERLRAAGLPVSGRKADLIARLGGTSPELPSAPVDPAPADGLSLVIEACKQ